jgi:hypothetical protein
MYAKNAFVSSSYLMQEYQDIPLDSQARVIVVTSFYLDRARTDHFVEFPEAYCRSCHEACVAELPFKITEGSPTASSLLLLQL